MIEAAIQIIMIGTIIGVEEATQGFEGRSNQIAIIKTIQKPNRAQDLGFSRQGMYFTMVLA